MWLIIKVSISFQKMQDSYRKTAGSSQKYQALKFEHYPREANHE